MLLTRIKTIKLIIEKEGINPLYITSTGMISREFNELNVNNNLLHFPMMGSMGNTLGIGIGCALNSNRKIVVIEGDGSALMGYSNIPLYKFLNLDNLIYYILDNNCYASTGGQKTISKNQFFKVNKNTFLVKVTSEKGNSKRIVYSMAKFFNKIKSLKKL